MDSQRSSVTIISLVDPTRNDSESLANLAYEIDRALSGYDYEIILVQKDGSVTTKSFVGSITRNYPIKIVYSNDEEGSPIVASLNQASGEVIGIIERDFKHSIEMVPQLLASLEDGADIAVASRYVPGGGIEGQSTGGRLMSKGVTLLARLLLPSVKKVKDPLSGVFMFRKEVAEGIRRRPARHGILLGTLAGRSDWQVREIPYVQERTRNIDNDRLKERLNSLGQIFRLATRERELWRFIQFGLVGLSGVGVNMGTFWFFTRIADLKDLVALVFAYIAATLSNFILNDIWTFRDRRVGKAKATAIRGLKFGLVSGGAIAIYYAVYTPLTRYLDLYDLAALAIAIGIGLIWNFSINVLWTWKKEGPHAPSRR